MPGVCPCSRNDNGESAIALIACVALILAINLIWRKWSTMSTRLRIMALVGVTLLTVGPVACIRSLTTTPASNGCTPVADGTATPATQPGATATTTKTAEHKPLPRVVDLGAKKCIPCKKMAPILEELKIELAGKAQVEFIDVWENEKAGELYAIRMIPTQIFYDTSGKETWRHEGFLPKEDILTKLREAGMQ
jgi:thioredoxin 1